MDLRRYRESECLCIKTAGEPLRCGAASVALGFAAGPFWWGSLGMGEDVERRTGTYEGRTLLPALGRKPSSLATQAEFPTAMLSHTRHLASAKWGKEKERGRWGGGRGEWGVRGRTDSGRWRWEKVEEGGKIACKNEFGCEKVANSPLSWGESLMPDRCPFVRPNDAFASLHPSEGGLAADTQPCVEPGCSDLIVIGGTHQAVSEWRHIEHCTAQDEKYRLWI